MAHPDTSAFVVRPIGARRWLWRAAFPWLGACLLGAAPALATTTYTITEAIQFAPDGTVLRGLSLLRGMSQRGHLVSQCQGCSVFDPATGAVTSVVPLANGSTMFQAFGVNSSGQVAGSALNIGAAVRNADGTHIELGAPSATVGPMWANAINDSGVTVGVARDTTITSALCYQRAVRWDAAGNAELLGTLPATPTPWSVARGMNSLGQAVGQSAVATSSCGLASSAHAVLFTPNGPKDLHAPSLPPVTPGLGSAAVGLNDRGIAVGYIPTGGSFGAQINRAIVWDTVNDTYVLMGNGTQPSGLNSVNNAGTVVGFQGSVAVVGGAGGGPLVDLNTLVPGKPPTWTLSNAIAINENGQIGVQGSEAGRGLVAFLLTPITTPTPPAPAAPGNLVASAVSATEIRLRWADNATNETSQTLTRCSGVGCSTPIVLAANAVTHLDSGLGTGVAYSYTVRAQGAGGESLPSNTATATPAAPPPPVAAPAAPSGLTATAAAGRQISLRWADNASNETGTSVYRCQGSGCTSFALVAALGPNTTQFQDTAPGSNLRLRYRVRASNAGGNSAFSNTVSVTSRP